MVPLFEQNAIELCLIFKFNFIYQRHHRRLESWNLQWNVQMPYLQRYPDTVARKGAPL